MKKILGEIQSGEFAKEFLAEMAAGGKMLETRREETRKHQIEVTGAKLRSMMPWIQSGKIIDKTKN